jgi:hypothetical protein
VSTPSNPDMPEPEMAVVSASPPSVGLLDRLLVGTDGISSAANIAGLGLLI